MSVGKAYTGTKPADFADTSKAEMPLSMGIYKGLIKDFDTSTRSGRLWVYVDGFGGADPNNPSNWSLVSYASPFMGATAGPASGNQANTFTATKQSYGFFMSPPDLGNQVLCCFPQGKTKEGYWFACISPNLSKRMMPASGTVPWTSIDVGTFIDPEVEQLRPYLKEGTPYPAGEFNENDSNVYKSTWFLNKYPLNTIATGKLIQQGLDTDFQSRGAISSSVQRDPISTVFGFSTPGRPFPGQDPKNVPDLQNKLLTGNFTSSDFTVTGRVGGHSLTMDDGDIYGKSNLVKMKSAAGHQILMNDSDGFMYISNSAGTAWVELANSGDILIYSGKDLAIRTEGNLMMHSDQNINLNAGVNFNVRAGADVTLEAPRALSLNAGQILNMHGRQAQLKSSSVLALVAGANMVMKSNGQMALIGSSINLNGGGGGGEVGTPSMLPRYLSADAVSTGIGWQVQTNRIASIAYKIPTHEPYIRGSVSALIAQQEQFALDASNSKTTTTISGENVLQPQLGDSSTVEQARLAGVKRPAPTGAFIKQADPGQNMGVLSNDELRAYLAQTGYTESGGKYDTVNQFGYVGKYQLGSAALQDLGYVKPGTPQTPEALANPNNWTGANGRPASLDEFLASPSTQEQAMYNYTKSNYNQLQVNGVITADTNKADIAGYLSASHLAGAGGTTKWYNGGVNSSDANGTTISQYFNQGRYSQTQVRTIQASNNSKLAGG